MTTIDTVPTRCSEVGSKTDDRRSVDLENDAGTKCRSSVLDSELVREKPKEVGCMLRDALTQDKYALHLSAPEVAFMQNLLRDRPEVFRKIQGTVDSIMADGKVDIFDVPQLIHLCSQLYHEHVMAYAVREVGVISLMRFTVDALLDSGLLPVHGVAKDVIKKVVDTSLELLRTNVTARSMKSCWDRFFRCGCTGCTGCTGCKGCRE